MKPKTIMILVGILALVFVGSMYPVPKPEISLKAETVAMIAGFPISNALIATWITMAVLIVIAWRVTRRMSEVPSGLQNFVEFVLEWILNLCGNVAGKNARRFFPLVATIFVFVILNNWMGLLPGYGTIGMVVHPEPGHAVYNFDTAHIGSLEIAWMPSGKAAEGPPAPAKAEKGEAKVAAAVEAKGEPKAKAQEEGKLAGTFVPILRGASTTLTTTVALALVAVALVEFYGITSLGFFPYAGKFVNVRRLRKGNPMGIIDAFVGVLEGIAEGARIISFGFRLFGNMFAGEVLLFIIPFLVAWALPLVFYVLEMFVGAIQALVFALLTLVFATMAATSHSEAHEAHH